MINSKYRVDFILVKSTQAELTAIQSKINQWITKGEIVSYKHTVVGDNIMFEICRVKSQEGY